MSIKKIDKYFPYLPSVAIGFFGGGLTGFIGVGISRILYDFPSNYIGEYWDIVFLTGASSGICISVFCNFTIRKHLLKEHKEYKEE